MKNFLYLIFLCTLFPFARAMQESTRANPPSPAISMEASNPGPLEKLTQWYDKQEDIHECCASTFMCCENCGVYPISVGIVNTLIPDNQAYQITSGTIATCMCCVFLCSGALTFYQYQRIKNNPRIKIC